MTADFIERVTIARDATITGVEVKSVTNAARLWRVFHERFDLVCTLRGVSERRFRRRLVTRAAGDVMLYEPGDFDVNTSFAPESAFVVIHIDPPVLARAFAEATGGTATRFTSPEVTSPRLVNVAETMARTWFGHHSRLARETCLVDLYSRMFEDYITGASPPLGREPRAVARLREYLHSNERDVSLDALAEATGFNKFYLVRLARFHLGTSPHAYHTALRVGRARTILREGATSPARLARSLGFSDQSHFHRVFLRQVGITPAQYRSGTGDSRRSPGRDETPGGDRDPLH